MQPQIGVWDCTLSAPITVNSESTSVDALVEKAKRPQEYVMNSIGKSSKFVIHISFYMCVSLNLTTTFNSKLRGLVTCAAPICTCDYTEIRKTVGGEHPLRENPGYTTDNSMREVTFE